MSWACANKITLMVCAAVVEQISIPLTNNVVNEITEIMTCSKSQQMHQDYANERTPMVYPDDTGQITI